VRTLTVTKTGQGSGTVTSSPAGINCGQTCVATFANGTTVTLTATRSGRSRFAGWTGDCSGAGVCVLSMTANHSVTAKFVRLAAPCVVPRVVGMTVGKARSKIARSHCGVGSVTLKTSTARKKGKVLSQTPRPGKRLKHGAKVRLAVGKGPKKR
jgi:PASTA domain/Divergent InlB B-repeat domain